MCTNQMGFPANPREIDVEKIPDEDVPHEEIDLDADE